MTHRVLNLHLQWSICPGAGCDSRICIAVVADATRRFYYVPQPEESQRNRGVPGDVVVADESGAVSADLDFTRKRPARVKRVR